MKKAKLQTKAQAKCVLLAVKLCIKATTADHLAKLEEYSRFLAKAVYFETFGAFSMNRIEK